IVLAQCCVFNKQWQPPILCGPVLLSGRTTSHYQCIPSPEGTVSIWRVPSPGFSQAAWDVNPVPLCRFPRASPHYWSVEAFPGTSCNQCSAVALFSHTLELRARICLSAFYSATTGMSNTPMTCHHPFPHRILQRCWNINQLPISYASLPRLRGRLTLRR